MSSVFWGLTLVVGSLLLFASGETILCSDPNDENCVLKLKTLNIFNPHRRESYRPIYRLNKVLDLSNHALTRLILQTRNAEATTNHPILDSSAEFAIYTIQDRRDEVPYIPLYGITDLILSNNNITVEMLVTILRDHRLGETQVLKYLDLSYLNISWLPDYIFERLSNIEVLRLNNNPICDMINVQYPIRQLKNLKALDISGCGLKSLPLNLFEDIHLTKLNLNDNLFTAVPRLDSLSNSLLKLSVDNNPISVLDDTSFSTLYVIGEISAENCSIHAITGGTFSTNERLRKLNLKNNNIRHLLPNDIPFERAVVSLENNPWDCTCRNSWLMMETRNPYTVLDRPHKLLCGSPALYANRSLYEAAAAVEGLGKCDLLFLRLLQILPPPPPDSDLMGSFMSKKAMTNLFIIVGLLAVIAIVATLVLIRKFNYNSRLQTYKPLHKILQHKDIGLLNEKTVQHM